MPVSAQKAADALIVLVVENELVVRFNIANYLRDAGYVVFERTSGEEAISLCKSGTPVDMVFTDINLGGAASGWDVAECFRKQRPGVPVLLTSGDIDPAFRLAGYVFIPKPYRNSDILSACQRLCK